MLTSGKRSGTRCVGATWQIGFLLLGGVIVAVLLTDMARTVPVLGPSRSSTPRSQATQLITRELIGQSQADPVVAQANAIRDRLKLPVGVRRLAEHVQDASTKENYDEVDELDSQGRVVSLTTFSSDQLRTAIRFDMAPQVSTPIDQSTGVADALKAATGLGLVGGAPDRSYDDTSTGGWVAQWDRTANGVPVRGDGTLVRVWADGRIASVSHKTHPLAAAPLALIDASSATQQVKASMQQLVPGSSNSLTFQTPGLEWVRPNGAFDASRSVAEDPVGRLAWVVNVEPADRSASSFTLLTFFIDAGDSTLLGGDVVE